MIQVTEKEKCTGCGACFNVCPASCIEMIQDELGFLYPTVNQNACMNCGLCEQACPVMNIKMPSDDMKIQNAYAVRSKDNESRMNSSSGGVFSLIAQRIIEDGGIVYGAVFDEFNHVHHVAALTASEIIPIRGSKFVQSNIGIIYQDVKNRLEDGYRVLFSGTPCQVSGLLHYLKKPYDLLISQDIICHGVCSLTVYDKYLSYMAEKQGSEIQSIRFRDKKTGWRDYSISICYADGTKTVVPHVKDELMRSYLRNYALRPSCYECPFKGQNRQSDITLADFWGIEHFVPNLDDDKGVSFVVCNSSVGEQFINSILSQAESEKVNYAEVIKFNMSGEVSSFKPNDNDKFCEAIINEPFKSVIEKYCKLSVMSRIKRIVKRLL